jgi:hypothetical protein
MTGSSILSRLFGDRVSKSVSARRKRHSRLDRPSRSPHLEGLEKRQMLTVDMAPEVNIDWVFSNTGPDANGNRDFSITPVIGEDGIELTFNDIGDAIFVQRALVPI